MSHYKSVFAFLLAILAANLTVFAQPPSLEAMRNVTTSITSIKSAASDGYGQHVVGIYNGDVKHYLLDNNGAEVTAFTSTVVSGGTYPVITSHGGKLRVTLELNGDIKVYQSTNGGQAWQTSYTHDPGVSIYDIDAFSNENGTHIVWATGEADPDMGDFDYEVYYRMLDNQGQFINAKNVTDLSSPSTGARPRVTASSGEALVAFIGGDDPFLFSRDLTINSGTWDGAYASMTDQTPSSNTVSVASIGSDFYAILGGALLAGEGCLQHFWFTKRASSSSTWDDQEIISCTDLNSGYHRNNLIEAGGKLYFIGADGTTGGDGITTSTYTPGTGWSTAEVLESRTGDQIASSIMITKSQHGVYYFWAGSSTSIHWHMRRKPFVITGNIAYNSRWTGNNWIQTRSPQILAGVTVDAIAGSETIILEYSGPPSGSWLNIYGTLNVNAASGGSPAAEITCEEEGEIILHGGQLNNNGVVDCPVGGACLLVQNYGGNTGRLSIGAGNTQTFSGGGFLAMNGGELSLGSGATLNIESGGSMLKMMSNSSYVFGSNSKIQLWGTAIVMNSVVFTLPRTGQFYAYAGSEFEMGNQGRLNLRGYFRATGTSANPIVFGLLTEATSWERINISNEYNYTNADAEFTYCEFSGSPAYFRLETPVKTKIQNCTFSNPTTAIQIAPDLTQATGIPSYQLSILNNSFNSCGSYGITIQGYSNVLIQGNEMTGANTTSTTGISLNGSSPKILSNIITLFNKGVVCASQSSPLLAETTGGHNVIKSNTYGVRCTNGSNAVLGNVCCDPTWDGQNSIFSNSTYNIELSNNCNVFAENNYWGGTPPQNFSVDGSSTLDYNPYLTQDPNPITGPGGNPKGYQTTVGGIGYIPEFDPLGDHELMNEAIENRLKGDYQSAVTILQNVVESEEEPDEIKQWAVSELLANAQFIQGGDLADYLDKVVEEQPDLVEAGRNAMVTALIDQGDISAAIVEMDNNIEEYPNSMLEMSGLYGRFSIALFRDEDLLEAEYYSDLLFEKYPNSEEAELASSHLALAEVSGLGKRGGRGTNQVPSSARLHQNFPNPFNPTTIVRYDLKIDGNVSIKVYDILGEEVATLTDGFQRAGFHQISFDASRLATGVYFYRLTAGSFTDVKKLVVVK